MAKELLLYSGIYDYVAEDLISALEEYKNEDISLRLNTPGGSVFSGWGIIAKMREHEGKIKVKIDGIAASMGAVVVVFADEVEMLDVSRIMIHRADMYVSTPEQQAFLNSVNKDLKAKLISKINVEKLKQLKGISIDEIFDPEKRIDVWLNAKESKEIGLVTKIVKVKPEEAKAISDAMLRVAAEVNSQTKISIPKPENKIMTLAELKAQHPAVFAEAVAEGATQERDRVEAWMAFVDIDAEAVTKGISEGKVLSGKAMAEFTRKGLSVDALKKISADSATTVTTTEVKDKEKDAKAKALEAFQSEVKADLNLK